jgi:hydroxymethylpyrimidine kinase/phosphomethylpyrimidine kinase
MNTQGTEETQKLPVALTIAGSDSGGGAGIQADLKTFSALHVFGTSAITAVTAQNPARVTDIYPVSPNSIVEQIKAVCDGFAVSAAKTGMLFSAEIIRAVAKEDVREGIPILVVDPVMVTASGAQLLQKDAVEALCKELLPQARVVTPNVYEAEILSGHKITSLTELRDAAGEICELYDTACLVKGGHLGGDEVTDVLFDEGEESVFTLPRVEGASTHGAGCAYSAAITAFLARGYLLKDAVFKAKEYVRQALLQAVPVGNHRPLNFFWNADLGAI